MNSPITQLIEEIKCDIHKVNTVVKRAGLTDCHKKIFIKQKETLCEVLLNLENNYLTIEQNYLNKLKK